MPRLVRVLVGLVAASTLVVGCSALTPAPAPSTSAPAASVPATTAATTDTGPSDGSLAGDCSALGVVMETAATTLDNGLADLGSDPQKALKALQSFTDTLEGALAKVTNPQLKAQGDKTVAALKDLISSLSEGIKDPTKLPGMTSKLTKVQEELTAIGTVCS